MNFEILLICRSVRVIRLVGRNSVEEIILKRAEEKLKLTGKVIEGGQFGAGSKTQLFAANKTQVTLVTQERCTCI